MFEYILIAVVTLFVSIISFYSGFGLGTILMPIIAIFLPLQLAIALTAVVHLFHNSFKTTLVWKKIDWKSAIKFGSAAIIFTIPGAFLLKSLSGFEPIKVYSILKISAQISVLHIIIGILLILFASIELLPKKIFQFNNLYVGGMLSGFLGGFSGHQGAFRSLFLINTIYEKKAFIGTNAVISVTVDFIRLIIYGFSFWALLKNADLTLLMIAIICGILGNIIGIIFLKAVTITFIQKIVVFLLYLFGILFIFGIL